MSIADLSQTYFEGRLKRLIILKRKRINHFTMLSKILMQHKKHKYRIVSYLTVRDLSIVGMVLYCEQSQVIAQMHKAGRLFLNPSQIF